MCTGSEQSIFNCSHGGIGQSFACGHAFDLGVVCEGISRGVCLSVQCCLSVSRLSVCLSVCQSACLSVCICGRDSE